MEKILLTVDQPSNFADALGHILAAKAVLEKREKILKESIKKSGGVVSGDLFLATVVESDRETIDAAAVRQVLTADELELVIKHTTVKSVRVTAHNSGE